MQISLLHAQICSINLEVMGLKSGKSDNDTILKKKINKHYILEEFHFPFPEIKKKINK